MPEHAAGLRRLRLRRQEPWHIPSFPYPRGAAAPCNPSPICTFEMIWGGGGGCLLRRGIDGRLTVGLTAWMVHACLQGAVLFAVTMQKKTMSLAYPQELLTKDGFTPEYSSSGEVRRETTCACLYCYLAICVSMGLDLSVFLCFLGDLQMLACGLTIKVGISYGTPVIRQPDQTTGRAVYRGLCVSRSCQIVAAASPGQVRNTGDHLFWLFGSGSGSSCRGADPFILLVSYSQILC